jgi:hypothetical protein
MMNLNMTMQNNRAYLGADGLKNYLKPKADEYIPLVELPSELNPFLESHDSVCYCSYCNYLCLLKMERTIRH